MYSCKFCGRTFNRDSSCTQHEKYYCSLNPDKVERGEYREHKKVACSICGKPFDVANIKRHENSCSAAKVATSRRLTHDGLNCEFCSKLCKNKNSLAQHELRCKHNPYRKDFNNLATFVKIEPTEAKQNRYEKCRATLLSKIASGEVLYDDKVRAKYKFGTYRGYHCDSSWELAFVIYNLDHNIKFSRNTECFSYQYEKETHYYYPDFVINNTYYEIKSYFTDKVYAKCEAFPDDKQLVIIDKTKIQPYLDYCVEKYGKDFITLYDKASPSWLDYIT